MINAHAPRDRRAFPFPLHFERMLTDREDTRGH